ncbi:MAG: RluA family pseudouridine synthase [Lachnospiraceae bacterium]|nr:RluA family pseudouridine synthase [Lachnospiraceae bacterium]
MKLVVIGRNEEGQRVDRLVGKLIPHAEKGLVYKAIRKKIVTLNGKKTEPDVRVKEGDELRLFFSDDTLRDLGGMTESAVSGSPNDANEFSKSSISGSESISGKPEKSGSTGKKKNKGDDISMSGYVFSENIIYEDSDVILVYKPAGILSQGSGEKTQKTGYHNVQTAKNVWSRNDDERKGRSSEASLNNLLIEYLEGTGKLSGTGETFRPSVCNRLDRNTSGIVVCGCSLKGLREMSELIRDRKLKKFYLCAVKGVLTEPGDLKGWLVKDEKTNKVRIYKDKQGLPDALNIETKYSPLKSAHNMTLLEVELVTGRPHQIRAHMASIGHPVAGDPKYGDPSFNRLVAKEYGIKHQALTARRLVFPEDCRLEILKGKEFICKDPDWFEIF